MKSLSTMRRITIVILTLFYTSGCEWNVINDIVTYTDKHADGLELLYTLLGGVIVALLFIAKPIVAKFWPKKDSQKDTTTIINVTNTLSAEAVNEILSAAKDLPKDKDSSLDHPAESPGHANEESTRRQGNDIPIHITEKDVLEAGKTLSQFRSLLKPSKVLSPEVFPESMRVLKYVPEKMLVIVYDSSIGEKGCFAAFSVIHWMLFPGLAGAFIGHLFFGEPGSQFGRYIGATLGLFQWFRLSKRGPYIKINLEKERYSLICVTSISSHDGLPSAELSTVYEENQWIATVSVEGQPVATNVSSQSQTDAEMPLKDFVQAFKWRMGNRITVADGVFIEPSES